MQLVVQVVTVVRFKDANDKQQYGSGSRKFFYVHDLAEAQAIAKALTIKDYSNYVRGEHQVAPAYQTATVCALFHAHIDEGTGRGHRLVIPLDQIESVYADFMQLRAQIAQLSVRPVPRKEGERLSDILPLSAATHHHDDDEC